MAERRLLAKQIQRHDTSQNWLSKNPVLLEAEIGVETNTGKFKIGDGTTAWNSLKYPTDGATSIIESNTSQPFNIWVGTEEEYLAISVVDVNTIYIVR